jgi:hypothetical protein
MTSIVTSSDIQDTLKALTPGTFNERRTQLRGHILQAARRRSPVIGEVDPEALFDPASVEAELDKVWPKLSPQQFIRELYGSKERLKLAGANASQVNALHRPAKSRIGDEPWTSADLAVLDQAIHAIQGVEISYGHIVVDEAQDLSIMQLKAIRRRSRTGSMTIVGDIAQSTSAYARHNWDQVLKELSSKLPANSKTLEIGYRVPKQVFHVAERVLGLAAPEIGAPDVLRDVPEPPRWFIAEQKSLGTKVVDAVQEHSAKGLFVGVIASAEIWPVLRESFKSRGSKWSESADGGLSQGINLVTPEDSKGLEFDAVVVVDPQRILNETQGARLLYVALTRTVHFLDVVMPEGKIPNILADFLPGVTPASEPKRAADEAGEDGVAAPAPAVHEEAPSGEDDLAAGSGHNEIRLEQQAGVSDPSLSLLRNSEAAPITLGATTLPAVADTSTSSKKAKMIPSRSDASAVPGILPNPLHEAIAQELGARFFAELQEEAGRAVQRRVLELLAVRIESRNS